MAKSRALKEQMAQPTEMKPKSKMGLLKDMHKQGKEDMMYGKEMMVKGQMKIQAARIMMKEMPKGMGEDTA